MKFLYKGSVLFLASAFLAMSTYAFVEPVVLEAQSDGVTVTMNVSSEVSISAGSDVTMSPNLGLSNDEAAGSTSWTVETSNAAGYDLAVSASTSPALGDGTNNFADYTEVVDGTPDQWAVDSGQYEFGFSAVGDDVATEHSGAAVTCETAGTLGTTALAYEGFTTSNEVIATSASATPDGGATTTLCLAAEQNGVFAPSGTYTATITATATAN